jgi:hypothetical protein
MSFSLDLVASSTSRHLLKTCLFFPRPLDPPACRLRRAVHLLGDQGDTVARQVQFDDFVDGPARDVRAAGFLLLREGVGNAAAASLRPSMNFG